MAITLFIGLHVFYITIYSVAEEKVYNTLIKSNVLEEGRVVLTFKNLKKPVLFH